MQSPCPMILLLVRESTNGAVYQTYLLHQLSTCDDNVALPWLKDRQDELSHNCLHFLLGHVTDTFHQLFTPSSIQSTNHANDIVLLRGTRHGCLLIRKHHHNLAHRALEEVLVQFNLTLGHLANHLARGADSFRGVR